MRMLPPGNACIVFTCLLVHVLCQRFLLCLNHPFEVVPCSMHVFTHDCVLHLGPGMGRCCVQHLQRDAVVPLTGPPIGPYGDVCVVSGAWHHPLLECAGMWLT
jgi:hypothetical protein